MKRVLLTGASGFIGRNAIAPLLERGYEVHAVRHAAAPSDSSAVWHQADLLDSSEVTGIIDDVRPSHLLHFAWYAVPRDYRESPENLRWVEASTHLLREFAAKGGRRAVFAGSCFEYDPRWGLFSETATPSAPNTLYAVCKDAFRRIATAFCQRAGLSAAWGRIFYTFGPWEAPQRLVPAVILALLRGERARCTHGRQVRDFLHVEDVARACVALLDSEVKGTVNIGSGEPVTVRAMVETIIEAVGSDGEAEFGAITPSATDPPVVLADVTRLRCELGFVPRRTLQEGLRATVEWWRKHPSG